MKFISVVGARPQFVKLGPLSEKIRLSHEEIIVHTGQHYDENMSKAIFEDLDIPRPDYNLEIGSGNHGAMTGKMIIELEKVFETEKPDMVIVFGDTNSTIAATLAAVKLHIPIIHIEAGLRSFNREMPEEHNRVMTDHAADYLFVPTQAGMTNLKNEGLANRAYLTGDIMVDALENNKQKALSKSTIAQRLNLNTDSYYLATLHRPYNVDTPARLKLILDSFALLENQVVFPVHPRTRKIIENNKFKLADNIIITEPAGYLDFLCLEANSLKIITDSGGIQKEAYIMKKPCLTVRYETEWVETIDDGWNILVNPDEPGFVEKIKSFNPKGAQSDVFGSQVANKMLETIQEIIA